MLQRKDILGLKDMSKEEILTILETAREMKLRIDDGSLRKGELKGKSMVTLFYENSTRTKTSFALAGKYLGATVQDLGVATSSVKKGESLIDTGKTLDQMGIDIMVMRNSLTGAPHVLAKNVDAHVINAGDGSNEHPTQALLDLYTILDYKKHFEGLKVAIIGDISHSRVARSNVFGLTKLGADVTLAGPSTLLGGSGLLGVKTTADVKEAITDADVVMGLRIQFERQKTTAFPGLNEYRELFGINKELLKYAKDDVLVMHPGPVNRGIELSTDVIDGKHSVINIQVKNGVAVRMAILKLLIEGGKK
ncbi:aspartate carbamoyltransferase [Tyzzerella sp. An114]|uniref:aspartate carbamoyltransferase catalytic subunit n=1 Tax=Tyzzerella sp. An114 TaxID=1965545 RepID=UPI000B4322A3|nr:aspartate carbamoyltransferase catalytic subunit [Tyzzerella sp. An114]OUQ59645.1 aspartate carbamoyltransferase [Tyzzerella sp. An114]